jgi:putative redox protein
MNIALEFPGGLRVRALLGGHVIETDQPHEYGGDDAFAAPFDLFLASVATCAGAYVLTFLQHRNLPTAGLRMSAEVEIDPESHLPSRIRLHVTLPEGVPEKYRSAALRAAESCRVKKTLAHPPIVEVVAAEPGHSTGTRVS